MNSADRSAAEPLLSAQASAVAPSICSGLTSVIIVTADSGAGVAECIARVLASDATVEVIVADNDSHDGSIGIIKDQFGKNPQVRILHIDKNIGFGAACNRGAALAQGDMLILLNPDCLIGAQTIARLRLIADADARIGVIGAVQRDESGCIDPASRRRDPLLRRALMSLTGLSRHADSTGRARHGVELPPSDLAVDQVEAISGALMLIRRHVFDQLGGFDEAYFLHCEDLDLCRRARDAGFSVVCANHVQVLHAKGGSSRHRPVFVAWHKHRGMWRWFAKFDPAARNYALRTIVFIGIWTHFLIKLPGLALQRLLRSRSV